MVSIVLSFGLLVYNIGVGEARAIYDYSTSLLDLIFFFFGSLYFAIGSYALNSNDDMKKSSDPTGIAGPSKVSNNPMNAPTIEF